MTEERFCFTWGLGKLGDMGFVPLYAFMLRTYAQLGLTRQEMLCITHLASYHYNSPQGESRPSLENIATQMGYSHKQRLYEIVAALEEKGMLIVTRRPGTTSIYSARPFARAAYKLWFEMQAAEQQEQGGTPHSTTSDQGGTPQSTPKILRGTTQSTTVVLPIVPEEEKEETKGQEEESFLSLSEEEEKGAVWAGILDELKLQMTKQTYGQWLAGSKLRSADNGLWTVEVVSPYAVDWLNNRLMRVVQRVVDRHEPGVSVEFVARGG